MIYSADLPAETSAVDFDSEAKRLKLDGRCIGGWIEEPLLSDEEIQADKSASEKVSLAVNRAMEQLFPGITNKG